MSAAARTGEANGSGAGDGPDRDQQDRREHSRSSARAFLDRIYTPDEIAYCQRKKKHAAESFAARFAAKEAGAKALGTGISRGVSPGRNSRCAANQAVEPTLHLSGRAQERASELRITRLSLSLTHSRDVIAVVVAEGHDSQKH